MTTAPDHYATLQVDPRAEPEVIDAAYRRLAAKYHPDVNDSADALEYMQQLNAAYEVLSDPDKRNAYDRTVGWFSRRPASARPMPASWRASLRRWLVPAGIMVFLLLFPRVGPGFAFIAAGFVVFLGYYWLS